MIQERLVNFKSKFGLHCLGRDRAFRRFWVFDSVPGLFVEHDDGEVGCFGEISFDRSTLFDLPPGW